MVPFIPGVPIPSPLHHPPPPPSHSSHHNQNVCLAYVDGAFVIKGLLGGKDVLALIVLGVLAEHSSNCPPSMAFSLRLLSTKSSATSVLDHALSRLVFRGARI